ncbi:MerR family DNA-binding transcriptional regulator [Ruminococcaceae bacterium OttesenSCG-928-L11]|nr:MerR family DNA-binding transcriptional regulator [Ruminococcaceae bacterium OttesenSCG-928-L11]
MQEKQTLISIGEMAKITGINMKCLRYYDRIGVLKPVFTNPESGYRYYSVCQLYIAEIIRLCIELDIPLRDLADYTGDNQNIDFPALLEYARKMAQLKMEKIKRGLNYIQSVQKGMERADKYTTFCGIHRRFIPQRLFLTLPFKKGQDDRSFPKALHQLFRLAEETGVVPLYDFGILCEYCDSGSSRCIYMEVGAEGSPPASEHLHTIPEGEFTCKQTVGCQLEQAAELLPDLFETDGSTLVIETEILTCNCRKKSRLMELQAIRME